MGSTSIAVVAAVLLSSLALFANPTFSADSPSSPPSISPSVPPVSSPPPTMPPSTAFNSPPAPPPSDLAPATPPSPSTPSPSPDPVGKGGSHVAESNSAGEDDGSSSKSGWSAGKKAGVAVAVIAGACVVGVGALVYRKRKQNVQRAQYGYAAREFL